MTPTGNFQPDPNKCQLCDAIVPDGEKKEHVKKEHMNATLACVVTGCTYDTTADYFQASIRISSHLVGGVCESTSDVANISVIELLKLTF